METKAFNQEQAIEWLKNNCKEMIDHFEDNGAEMTADIIKDLLEDIETIKRECWEWVAVEECAMAVSNINVREMVIK